MHKRRIFWLTALPVMVGLILASFAPKDEIILKDDPLQITPAGFYIASVTDDREQKGAIAQLAIAGSKKIETHDANLQGGMANGIRRFLNKNLKKDTSLRAINISIKNFKLTETVLPNGGIDGRVQLSVSFGQTKDYGVQQLLTYQGGSHYTRLLAGTDDVEARLRSVIKSSLVYFNHWMQTNVKESPRLAKTVAFTFADYTEKSAEGDTIYYATARPLKWNDFQSKTPVKGPFTAMVMPSFGYDLTQEVKKGVINVHIALKTYLAKSDSWTGGTSDAYGLNHEQRHFDIARIITRRFQQKILAAGLTPDTYEAFINMQYLDSYRDMNAMQKAYDKETRHGINDQAQVEWDKKIDAMLKE